MSIALNTQTKGRITKLLVIGQDKARSPFVAKQEGSSHTLVVRGQQLSKPLHVPWPSMGAQCNIDLTLEEH